MRQVNNTKLFLTGAPEKPETGNKNERYITNNRDNLAGVVVKQKITKKNVGEDQQRVVRLAADISNNDFDWILTLEAENGLWDMYRRHPYANKNGTVDWACGLNSAYHKDMISKIQSKEASEEDILRYCYDVYKQRPTAFYGYYKRLNNINKFVR